MSIIKPDFSPGHGAWVDPEFIPAEVRRSLMLALVHSPLTDAQKSLLLEYANDIGQMVLAERLESGKKQREQIEAIATNARRLLSSMKLMGAPARDTLNGHTDYLAYGSAPPVEIEQHIKEQIIQPGASLLSSAWDWVAALESSASYAAEQFNIDKTSKPAQMRGRGFVARMAGRVRELTGVKPPKDPAAWFAEFVECLGQHLEIEIGPRIVASGIKAIR
jgi:hypothetical protein